MWTVLSFYRFSIIGNPFEDFFASLFLYPCVAVQLEETTNCLDKNNFKQKQVNVEMNRKETDVENGKVNEAFDHWTKEYFLRYFIPI